MHNYGLAVPQTCAPCDELKQLNHYKLSIYLFVLLYFVTIILIWTFINLSNSTIDCMYKSVVLLYVKYIYIYISQMITAYHGNESIVSEGGFGCEAEGCL